MQCEERNRLFKEFDVATRTVRPYPESTNGVPQSYADVQKAQQLQKTLHEKSVALEEHEKTHGCRLTETRK
jgi:hypothetical protein